MNTMLIKNMSFKVGQTLTVTGVPKADATNFAMNIGPNEEDIVLHMNPRFEAHGDQRAVVCNSYQGGKWCEEYRKTGFPFKQGEEFKFKVTFTKEEFLVTLSDGTEIHFPNRLGEEKYRYIGFDGDVRIHGIEIN